MAWRRRSRRRRNAPWGSSIAEHRHLNRGSSRASGVDLGRFEGFELENGRRIRPRGEHLAWMPAQRALALVRKVKGRPGRISDEARRIHRQFHRSEPRRAALFDWPDPRGGLRPVARIKVISYLVPAHINSPGKRQPNGEPILWVHAFGDHGESGHGEVGHLKTYPRRLMPMLCEDRAGNLYVKRLPGNKFRVSDWIYW